MHGQGNYPTQVGRGPYAPPPAFHQHPATSAPPPASNHGPRPPPPPLIQQGRPSFHFTPGIYPHQHAIPGVAHQRPPDPAISTGMGSARSYLSHPQPPQVHVSSKMSHSYQTSEQQHLPWGQNAHQLLPLPSRGPNAYPTPSSQVHALERVQHHQALSHAPPTPPPPHSSSSSFLTSESFETSAPSVGQHPYLQSMGPLPPPPPRPRPPPPSSPPRVPPLPPSSTSSDIPPKNDETRSLKGLLDGENLKLEGPLWMKSSEDRQAHQIEVPHQLTKNSPKIESVDAAAHSPADSDMDMEDDITHPDEEKKNYVSNNFNDELISIPQEDNMKEEKALLHPGGQRFPKVTQDGNSLVVELSITKDQRGGSGIMTDCDLPITRKVPSEAGNLGTIQTEYPLDSSLNTSSLHKKFSEPSLPMVYTEAGCGKLPCQELKEASDPFKLLQGYASNTNSDNEGEDLLRDLSPPPTNDQSQTSDAKKVDCVGSELKLEILLESDNYIPSKSIIESPKNATEADESSFPSRKPDKFSHRSHRDQESVSISKSASFQPKSSSSTYDANIGPEGINVHKEDMNSNSTKKNVDEFGRLIREGVSDSDMSDSSHRARRRARRSRKRSRSRTPHDRRRRRSPRRRKERRGRSRSFSPKRRRSNSRSPVLKRDSEYNVDKPRWGKGQLPECFDFRRGKCYRGAKCRYSHHESDKSERLRYSRGKHESKSLPEKEVKEKLPQDIHILKDVKDAKELPVVSAIPSPDKPNGLGSGSHLVTGVAARNLSSYSANDVPSGEQSAMISESPAQYSDKIPQIVDHQGIARGGSLIFEASLLQAAATSTCLTADAKHNLANAKCEPTSQLHSVGSPVMKSDPTEEVPSQSFKELPPSISNHPSHLNLVSSSASQVMSVPFPGPIMRDYNFMPPVARINLTAEHFTSHQAPVAYQHHHFPALLNSLSASFLPPPPPPPLQPPQPQQHSHLAVNVTGGEHSLPSQALQQSSAPRQDSLSSYTSTRAQPTEFPNQYQTGLHQDYPVAREPDQIKHMTDNCGPSGSYVSNLMNQQGGSHIMGEDRFTGNPREVMKAQPNSLLVQSPSKGTHSSLGGGLPSDSNSSHGRPYIQQTSYGLQYSVGPGQVSSSMARITPDYLERNHPSYAGDFERSRAPNHFNLYSSTFDHPLSSKLSSNAVIQENDTVNTKHVVPDCLSSVPINANKIGSVGSENMIPSSAALLTEGLLPKPGDGDQYDPLVDSIEPASTSISRADRLKYETTGDCDNVMRFSGSGRVLSMEGVNQDRATTVSANGLIENEEFGETADAEEVGAVLNLSPSDANVAIDTDEGEIEIDQVKVSGKQKGGKDSRSMRLFKISIATFVKEVLKPSWRQGNMSKEAFKTIVKKTVDKVSGAMRSRKIPKSQAKINHYIDSSRGKLTKLVMGYVDKYVKA